MHIAVLEFRVPLPTALFSTGTSYESPPIAGEVSAMTSGLGSDVVVSGSREQRA